MQMVGAGIDRWSQHGCGGNTWGPLIVPAAAGGRPGAAPPGAKSGALAPIAAATPVQHHGTPMS